MGRETQEKDLTQSQPAKKLAGAKGAQRRGGRRVGGTQEEEETQEHSQEWLCYGGGAGRGAAEGGGLGFREWGAARRGGLRPYGAVVVRGG